MTGLFVYRASGCRDGHKARDGREGQVPRCPDGLSVVTASFFLRESNGEGERQKALCVERGVQRRTSCI